VPWYFLDYFTEVVAVKFDKELAREILLEVEALDDPTVCITL
jgi:hypothetical protein